MAYQILINAVDRTADVLDRSVIIDDVLNDQQNTCNFELVDLSGTGTPSNFQEVIIYDTDGSTKLFAGYIVSLQLKKQGTGVVVVQVKCLDYVWLLDRNLVHKSYEDMTDKEIIEDLVATYCPGYGITTTNVLEGVTISQISFNYIQISQVMRKICDLTGRNWYIDYEKDVHYFPLATATTPFNITDSDTSHYHKNLSIRRDGMQLKNRIYVRGGTKLSDTTVYSSKGDGVKKQFVLPDKPHDVTITVNSVSKTVGIKNVHTSGYDWYVNYQEKYVEQDSAGSTLSSSDTLVVNYKYDIPILIAQEDSSSIALNGVKEFAIFDKSISTTESARERALAELTDYAQNLIEGTFITVESGFRSGQYITINKSEYGVNDSYIVQRVNSRSLGGGQFEYQVSLASSKTMGVIRFLIELLEAQKNLIELDPNEVVDELLVVTDALISDSLTDNLTIDSAGPYSTWCSDSLQSTPATRARWDLFQWG